MFSSDLHYKRKPDGAGKNRTGWANCSKDANLVFSAVRCMWTGRKREAVHKRVLAWTFFFSLHIKNMLIQNYLAPHFGLLFVRFFPSVIINTKITRMVADSWILGWHSGAAVSAGSTPLYSTCMDFLQVVCLFKSPQHLTSGPVSARTGSTPTSVTPPEDKSCSYRMHLEKMCHH